MTPGTAPVIAIPEPPGDFDGLGWINQHFSYELVYEELKPVLYFLLLWNLFEDKLCERNACPSKMRASVDKGSFKLSRYDVYMKFFKMTYFPNVEMSEDAINYFFRAGAEADEKTEVRDAFGVAEMDLRTDLYVLLLLVRRVRNNLFHGEKTVSELQKSNQIRLFHSVNGLLATYLSEACP